MFTDGTVKTGVSSNTILQQCLKKWFLNPNWCDHLISPNQFSWLGFLFKSISMNIRSNPIIRSLFLKQCSKFKFMKKILFFSAIFSLSVGCASITGQDSGSRGISRGGWNKGSEIYQSVHYAQREHERKQTNLEQQREQEAQERLMRMMDQNQEGRDELIRENIFWDR